MQKDKILEVIKNNPLISSLDLQHKFGFPRRTVYYGTEKLLETGLIKRVKRLGDIRLWYYRAN